jgi:DNA-binding beta-propeller fold protein YncE
LWIAACTALAAGAAPPGGGTGDRPSDRTTERPNDRTGETAQLPSRPPGTIYLGTFKGSIMMIDESTEEVIGEIPLKNGMATNLVLSQDKRRFYIVDKTREWVEIVDRVTAKTLDTFTLSEGRTKTRIWSLEPDPRNQYLILVTKTYTLHLDRWEIGPPTLLQYDLATKKIARTIPWPKGEEREGAGVLFSPDGKLMYLMGEDILIYETDKFTEVDRWELSRPLEAGAGRIQFGPIDPYADEPGFFTGLFNMQDPVQNRRIMGVGRIDLVNKRIDFQPIGPFRPVSFAVAPDRKRAYGLSQNIGEYEFWTFDLESRRVLSRTPFKGRPRMALRVNSTGDILYIYQAGNTIDLYEAASLKHLRTITLDGDMTTPMVLLPSPPRAGGRQ